MIFISNFNRSLYLCLSYLMSATQYNLVPRAFPLKVGKSPGNEVVRNTIKSTKHQLKVGISDIYFWLPLTPTSVGSGGGQSIHPLLQRQRLFKCVLTEKPIVNGQLLTTDQRCIQNSILFYYERSPNLICAARSWSLFHWHILIWLRIFMLK